MQDFSNVELKKIIIHLVGNKIKDEELKTSLEPCDTVDDITLQYLKRFFFSSFKFDISYRFTHEADIGLNEINSYTEKIFEDQKKFVEQSINIAKHLYGVSVHPNIKAGELYVVYFENCILDNESMDAIGIFKSETKDFFLEIKDGISRYGVNCKQGINTKKLDKGCLIFKSNTGDNKIYIVDSNVNDALYWKNNFLMITESKNEYFNTSSVLKTCKQFIKKTSGVEPKQKLNLINNSVQYFETHNSFELNEFADTVFQDEEECKKFKTYIDAIPDKKIEKSFDISPQAVSKIKRTIKNFIKLDSNIEIKINTELREVDRIIEKGYDERKNMKFYKIYYNSEE